MVRLMQTWCISISASGGSLDAEAPFSAYCFIDSVSQSASTNTQDVLIRKHRQLSIRPSLLDCDYYRFLEGDMEAVNAYRGVYMEDYSWAEMTTGQLVFPKQGTRLATVKPDQAGPRSRNSPRES